MRRTKTRAQKVIRTLGMEYSLCRAKETEREKENKRVWLFGNQSSEAPFVKTYARPRGYWAGRNEAGSAKPCVNLFLPGEKQC